MISPSLSPGYMSVDDEDVDPDVKIVHIDVDEGTSVLLLSGGDMAA